MVLKVNSIGNAFMQLRYHEGFLYACLVDGENGIFTLYRTNLKTGKKKKLGQGSDAIIYDNRIIYNYYLPDGNVVTYSMKLNGKGKKIFDGIVMHIKGKYFYGYDFMANQYYKFDKTGKLCKKITFEKYWNIYLSQKYYTSPTKYYKEVYLDRGEGVWATQVGKKLFYVDPNSGCALICENMKTGAQMIIHETPGLQFSCQPVGKYLYITVRTGGTPDLYLIKQNGVLVKQLH